MEASSGKVEDGKGNGVQLKVCMTAKNLTQDENGGYVVVAGRQGQQTDVEITVVGTPTGVALENNLVLEALLLGPDNMPVRHAKMKGYIAPALEQWTGASNRPSSDPNTRTTVSLPAQTPTPFTRTVSLKFLVLSGQVHGPLRVCLRPTSPAFAALQVIMPPMTCVARAKTDGPSAPRGSKRTRVEGDSPLTKPMELAEFVENGPAKGKAPRPFSECSVLAVIPPIGPGTPSRASVLVRVTSITIPFDLWLSKGYSMRVRADPEGDVTVYNGMAERLFRLPPLDIQKYAIHVQCGQSGLIPSALKYAVCSVAIEKPENNAVIVGNQVRFVFSVEPISCFEGKGFRLYLQDGRVIDTECKRTVLFDRLGPHFAVVEIVDEVYGSANFNMDCDEKVTVPRIRAVYELSDGEQRVVVLTDGRCFCTNVDLTGVQTEMDVRTRGPCPPVQSPCYYGIRSSRVNFTLISSVDQQKDRSSSSVRANSQQDDLLRQVGITQTQLAQILQLLSRPGMSLSLGNGNGGGGGDGGAPSQSSNPYPHTHPTTHVETSRAREGACQIIENLVHSIIGTHASRCDLIDLQDNLGNSILMQASALGSADCVTALLSAGANIHMRNKAGDLALHMAARRRNLAVLDVFYSLGHDFLLKGSSNQTVVDIFPEYWTMGRARLDSRPRMIWRPPSRSLEDESEEEIDDEEEERVGVNYFAPLPDDILVRIFSYMDAFQLCPIMLTCRRFRELARQSHTTFDPQRLDAMAQRMYKLRGNPLRAYHLVADELLGQRISSKCWMDFATAVSRAAMLEKESTKDEEIDPDGDFTVMTHTPEMIASCENTWRRLVPEGHLTVQWDAIARAMYEMFAPMPISVSDLEDAYDVIRGAVERTFPATPLPPREALNSLDRSSFILVFLWFFFAKRTFVSAQDLWLRDRTTMPFLSRAAADRILLNRRAVGAYVLRVSSYLWPEGHTGALALSTCIEDADRQLDVQHELLAFKEYSAKSILEYIRSSCPEAKNPLHAPPSHVALLPYAPSTHHLLPATTTATSSVHPVLRPPVSVATTRSVQQMMSTMSIKADQSNPPPPPQLLHQQPPPPAAASTMPSQVPQPVVVAAVVGGKGGGREGQDGTQPVSAEQQPSCGRYFAKKSTSSSSSSGRR